jgi:S-adenosylmethionine/arginine decarboxylase-like enzyme
MTPDVRHKHLVIRAEISNPPSAGDEAKVKEWMLSLIEGIDMKVMYGPEAMYCPVEGNRGMTGFAIIETSHCALHTWDECTPAICQLDVYTCSELTVSDVVPRLDIFGPTKIEYKFLDREFGLTIIDEKGGPDAPKVRIARAQALIERVKALVSKISAFFRR